MNSPVKFFPDFLNKTYADAAFERLLGIDWVQVEGRPRMEYWAADRPYTYGSGLATKTYEPQPWPYDVTEIAAEMIYEGQCKTVFEGCFLNRYDTNRDYLGWHSDDSPEIDTTKPIAIVTLGHSRKIQFKQFRVLAFEPEDSPIETVELTHGSLLLMLPGMQQTHLHRIPKSGIQQDRPRISLTYRGLI